MVELIHADGSFREKGFVTDFTQYDSEIALSGEGTQCDWMLEMPEEIWKRSPIETGDYLYLDSGEWGGPAERVCRSTGDGAVRIYGVNWRGLLARRVICPPPGETHAQVERKQAHAALRELLGGWMPSVIRVSGEESGIMCSCRVRYRTLIDAAEEMLAAAGARLEIRRNSGGVTLAAGQIRDVSPVIELSSDYRADVVAQTAAARYNHIIALGQGELLERTVVELWCAPDGTVTEEPDDMPAEQSRMSLLYDYSSVDSADELRRAARRKLKEYSSTGKMEIELCGVSDELELTDIASVRDEVTGLSARMTVTRKNLHIDKSGVTVKHILK